MDNSSLNQATYDMHQYLIDGVMTGKIEEIAFIQHISSMENYNHMWPLLKGYGLRKENTLTAFLVYVSKKYPTEFDKITVKFKATKLKEAI